MLAPSSAKKILSIKNISRIVIVRPDRLGDVILSLPVATAFRKYNPQSEVFLLTREYTRELGEYHPDISGVMTIDTNRGVPKPQSLIISELKEKRFDAALLLYPRFSLALMLYKAGIPVRVGIGYRWYSWLFNRRIYEHRKYNVYHEAEYNIHFLRALGIDDPEVEFRFTIPQEADEQAKIVLQEAGVQKGKPFIIMHPGNGGSAPDWPASSFSRLIEKVNEDQKYQVLITWGKGEETLVESIRKECRNPPPALKNTVDLITLSALIARSILVVAPSTGPLHMSVLVKTPVVGMYPLIHSCSPRRWGPYGQLDSVLQPDNPPHRSCYKRKCRKCTCMELISVEDVYKMMNKIG